MVYTNLKTERQYVLARKVDSSNHFELADKLTAHVEGWQHYAFSVFIFNSRNELLLQKRAIEKYHSPGLWTNTCCSHPLSSELPEIKISAAERLQEEMGISCQLNFAFRFEYNVPCGKLIENEIDYVFFGYTDALPSINPHEVADYKYVSMNTLRNDIQKNPHQYTEWLKIIMQNHYTTLVKHLA